MRIIFVALVAIVFLVYSNTWINGQECNGDLQTRISCYESNIEKLKESSKTLSNQIIQFDTQIKLTTLKISQTEEKINLLNGRIDELSASLELLNNAFNKRVIETYKMARLGSPVALALSQSSLTEVFSTYSYLKKIQDADRNLLLRLQKAHDSYEEEKMDQEDLQKQLEVQQRTLNSQKLAKKNLLDQTRNDEKKYQALLAQALAEKAAIEKALVTAVKVGPVKVGDPIGLVGNSGYPSCSTGKHLHFEIRKNNTWVDPASYLQNKTVIDEEKGGTLSVGSGGWPWPLQDTIRMTQHYGQTPWSWKYSYSGGIHTGFDLVSTASDVIRAPSDGNLYKASEKCGSSTINIIYIEHGNDLVSFYLHVQ